MTTGRLSRRRRTVAFACVALVVLTAVFPLGGTALDWCVYTPEFVLLPPIEARFAFETLPLGAEQLVALLTLPDGRGPPLDSF